MEVTTLVTGASGIKAAVDIVKYIRDSGLSLNDAEANHKLADLILALSDVKLTLAEKDEEILKLRAELRNKTEVVLSKPFYFKSIDTKKENPLCRHCYDKDMKLINLEPYPGTEWYCTVCHNLFDTNPRQRVVAHNIDSDYSSYGEQGWMR